MAATNQAPAMRQQASMWRRLSNVRRVLLAAVLVLLACVSLGSLPISYALIGIAVLLIVALLGPPPPSALPAAALTRPTEPEAMPAGLDAIVGSLPDPVIVLDREGRVVQFNDRALGMLAALRRGDPLSLALRVPDVVEAVRRVAVGDGPQRVEFAERVPLDRRYVAYVSALAAGSVQPSGLILICFQDLTALRRVEEMWADFVANASHELRTPLASLSGFIDTLQGPAREDGAARARFLAIMKTQAARMARLIDDLLSLSRVELHAHVQPRTPVELDSIVRQVADGLQMLAGDRNVNITIAPCPGPLWVLGDRDELIRVFENLVENALKYGADGGKVELTLTRAESADEAVIAVRDYGPGIAAEHLPRLTERFYRIDAGHSRAEGGTGLGLALVKHILNRHRGRLAIESRPGAGATFSVRLPLCGPPAKEPNHIGAID